jgi:hypothetical protein
LTSADFPQASGCIYDPLDLFFFQKR